MRARVHDRGLVAGIVDPVDQLREVPDVLAVEFAVRAEIGERARGQAERRLDAVGGGERERDAGAFEHVHHAEEPQRVAARDAVVRVRHHEFGGGRGLAVADFRRVGAACFDVRKYPGVVPALLDDVLVERGSQPGEPRRQAVAARLEQRHRMPHVMERFAQERDVARARHHAAQRVLDHGHPEERIALAFGARAQRFMKRHRRSFRGNGRGRRRGGARSRCAPGGRSACTPRCRA